MKVFFISLLLALLFAQVCRAALVSPIPGLPEGELPNGSKMYAGYFPLDDNGAATYYHFFTAENVEPGASERVVLWLTGGPGCSGINAAYTENGPLHMNFSGNGATALQYNPWTWSRLANVLYIESPRSVGFSRPNWNWTTPTVIGDDQTTKDSITAILEFFKEFPEMQTKQFFISAESYGGHYSLRLLAAIGVHNAQAPPNQQINLQGNTCGNCWTSPSDEAFHVVENWWQRNIISEDVWNNINKYCTYQDITSWIINNVTLGSRSYSAHDWEAVKQRLYRTGVLKKTESSELCFANLYEGSLVQFGAINILNIYGDVCVAGTQPTTFQHATVNWCDDGQNTAYLNDPEVQKALHVVTPPPWGWQGCVPNGVLEYNQQDTQTSYLPIIQQAVASGKFKFVYYSADADCIVPFQATRAWVSQMQKNLNLPVVNKFHPWFADSNGAQVAGWSTEYGNGFTFTTLREGSHTAPRNVPYRAYQLMKNYFVNGTM